MAMQSIYFLVFILASTCGLPVRYDQRQDGDLNVHAHLENFIIVFIPGSSSALSLLDVIPLKKNVNHHQANGVKLSAPDFPAAKSPYKVDLDKSEGEITKLEGDKDATLEIADEVMIAHVPAITITKPLEKGDNEAEESTTQTAVYEDATQKAEEEPAATEKVEKDGASDDSEKKENAVVKNTEEKKIKDDNKGNALETDEKKKDEKTEEKVEKEEKKEEKTEEKVDKDEKKPEDQADNIPVIDSAPGKPVKASKSIDFGIEAARPGLQRVRDDQLAVIERAARVKSTKVPEYRHEIVGSPEFAQRLKRLRTGINECQPGQTLTDDGQCVSAKPRQRTRSYFSSEDRMLPILQFGLSPADSSTD